MISVEDTIKTFLECINLPTAGKTEEDQKKITAIMQKSVVDLCYALVPESDILVSDKGIFQAPTAEKEAVMRSYFNEQRKAFFALATGIVTLKRHVEELRLDRATFAEEMNKKMDVMERRINGVVGLKNTALSVSQKLPATKTSKS